MKKSGRPGGGSGPGAAGVQGVPPTPTTLFNLSSLSFFSSSQARSRLDPSSSGPATTGGVATFANGATFGDPFSFDRSNYNSHTPTQQPDLPPLPPTPPQQPQTPQRLRQRQHQQQQYHHLQSPASFRGLRRRANSSFSLRDGKGAGAPSGIDTYEYAHGGRPDIQTAVIDNGQPPALPDFALSSAAKLSRDTDGPSSRSTTAKSSLDIARGYFHTPNPKMLSRTGTTPVNGFPAAAGGMPVPLPPSGGLSGGMHSESNIVFHHIQELANKRISTLEYLRKACVRSLLPSAP